MKTKQKKNINNLAGARHDAAYVAAKFEAEAALVAYNDAVATGRLAVAAFKAYRAATDLFRRRQRAASNAAAVADIAGTYGADSAIAIAAAVHK